jgi:hypothetical protein
VEAGASKVPRTKLSKVIVIVDVKDAEGISG